MGELVAIAREPDSVFMETAADVYIELLDKADRVKLIDVVDEMRARWGEYRELSSSALLARLQSKTFSEYLSERRLEHIRYTMAARLMAAEMGAQLGQLALDELLTRLRTDPESIKAKELLDIADRMVAWSEKLQLQVAETDDAKPKVEGNSFTQILMNVPPERAEAMAAEMARRAIAEGRK